MTKPALKALIAAATMLACAACATYSPPSTGSSAADLTLLFSGPATILYSRESELCASSHGPQLAAQGLFWANTKEPVRVAPDKRLYLEASSNSADYLGRTTMCWNVVSFIPEVGHSYALTHNMTKSSCSVHLVDSATGREPDSFVAHPYPERC